MLVGNALSVRTSGTHFAAEVFNRVKSAEEIIMAKKVYWVSRHDMSPAQVEAVRALHGADVEIVKDPVSFASPDGLAKYINSKTDGFVYAVAGAVHYLWAATQAHRAWGIFENHPQKRVDGTFGLAAVYHMAEHRQVGNGMLVLGEAGEYDDYPVVLSPVRVLENPDPLADKGELLIPVAR